MIRIFFVLFVSTMLLLFFSIQQFFARSTKQATIPKTYTTPVPTTYTRIFPTSVPVVTKKPLSLPTNALTSSPTLIQTPTPTKNAKLTATPSPPQIVRTSVKIMPLGDSITDGSVIAGGYRTQLWNQLVGSGAKVDFVGSMTSGSSNLGDWNHEGHIGWETGQLAANVGGWISAYQPDIVLIHTGTNDLDHGTSPEAMTQRLSSLIANIYAVKPNTYIIVSSIVLITRGNDSARASYNASIPGVVAQYASQGRRIVAIDMSNLLIAEDLLDGIHPNGTGYSKMASMWYPVVSTIYREYAGGL